MDFKPTIFIGSSKEGLRVAQKLKNELKDIADCNMWPDVFDYGSSNFDNLTSQLSFYDYAILIATGDDIVKSRGKSKAAARDNVLFEFGLFTGGLGKHRVFYVVEENTKIPSDLLGITLPFIPNADDENFDSAIAEISTKIKNYIKSKEKTFDLGFLPSTTLAYGYFTNFVERTVQRLFEDRADQKDFQLPNGRTFKIENIKFTILIPDDLRDDMFKKVKAKRLRDGWQKLKVDPKDERDYDFSVDVSQASAGDLHLVDIPFTLNALNKSIELYSKRQHIGKDTKEELLEVREIRNFKRTLEYLISQSSITKGIVGVEIVAI